MVMTRPARRAGGATKLVAWNTSTRPASHSTGGHWSRAHAACSSRAGTRRRPYRTPGALATAAGTAAARSPAPRQVNGTSQSSSTAPPPASPSSRPATYRPTPVRGPSSGVASTPTLTAATPPCSPPHRLAPLPRAARPPLRDGGAGDGDGTAARQRGGDQGHQRDARVTPVAAAVEAQGAAVVVDHLAVGGAAGRAADRVLDRGAGLEHDPPAGPRQSQAEVHVLEVHEIGGVEAAHLIEGRAAQQHAGARDPVHQGRPRAVQIGQVVAAGGRVVRPHRAAGRGEAPDEQRGKTTPGRVGGAVQVAQPRPDAR